MLPRALPIGFLVPGLPIKAPQPPSGNVWLHEIKLDGFRVIARKASERVRLYSRPGNDLTQRFPLLVEAVARLSAWSCIIDGEAGPSALTAFRHSTGCGTGAAMPASSYSYST
jgi:bifunctional non-homologous end joining protein LigD